MFAGSRLICAKTEISYYIRAQKVVGDFSQFQKKKKKKIVGAQKKSKNLYLSLS